jgi:RimJ/RimL family protein N-acetyltransferase
MSADGSVALRPRRLDDVAAQIAGQDDEITRWLDWPEPTEDGVRAMVEASMRAWDAGGPRFDFSITDAVTGEVAGVASLNLADPVLDPGEVNLAYAVYPRWRGRGWAGRTVELLCRWARENTGAATVILKIDEGNPASARVAVKAGFVHDGFIDASDGSGERWARWVWPLSVGSP